jgi:hypothetical protein
MKLRRTISTAVAVAALGVGAVSLAPAAGAQVAATPKDQACARAHDAWQRIVAANDKAVSEYHELRAKQQELLANGHDVAAHRLDARLDRARRAHEQAVARVLAVAQKVKGFCTEQPPTLAPVE